MKHHDENLGYEAPRFGPPLSKVGHKVPFSRTVDRDPNPRIPLSVPVETPRWIEALAWSAVAVLVGLVYWVVSL